MAAIRCLTCTDRQTCPKHHGREIKCAACVSSGLFIHNGKPAGGICYRCKGKGYHTQWDRARNRGHYQRAS